MTIRDAYENCLIELNKVLAPSLLLDDFIYLFNKSVQQYINKRYNLFETKQLLTDDLRVLTQTCVVTPTINTANLVFGKSYDCPLPDDYMHILNCVVEFENPDDRCDTGGYIYQGANKLDTNLWSHVINNYYMKPSIKQPYYYIINIDDPSSTKVTASTQSDQAKNANYSAGSETRYGNAVLPIMQIKCGDAIPTKVFIDYLKAPLYLSLDQTLLDDITDNSLVIEFPDYVVYEIVNEIVTLCEENASNPRVKTTPAVNTTIQ